MEKNEVPVLLSDIQERSAWRVDNDLRRLGQTERQRKPTTRMPRARDTHYVQALYDYSSGDAEGLDFREGDIIQVLTHSRSGWCDGMIGSRRGWFPGNYCGNLDDIIPERSNVPTARESAKGADISTPFGAAKDKSNKKPRGWLDPDDAATETGNGSTHKYRSRLKTVLWQLERRRRSHLLGPNSTRGSMILDRK